ncbi:hypothetical protein BAUCODRAFT_194318 [Baudoinia panamericana UAMH 10762]|uniref:Dihydrolipoamide acetyltransferase component of pyruvate dehydrogenase complex n=1 Tax=Baudoinia panamericana (strain UAMH 10762) TaxID=717646 RepID=M2NPZ3_BAUPA|nr:uncharacterized protein BAUCODRAFT_194318 [Baudoinia panamericana UAMH 10762]EMD01061.1 hypothetical protein BAUCODRAFT_194318 [Baudoinia panamericana UAMH 10762]
MTLLKPLSLLRFQANNVCHRSRSPFHLIHVRGLHITNRLAAVKPFLLADIGEGITECQLIQWFVQPGARVEQFDKLCEVQSDKASVEITSPFDGVIKKLHYEPDDMAITGKALVDIDIEGEISAEDEAESPKKRRSGRDMGTLATPAVRHLTKELKVDIADVQGTGKDGRVMKEDVHRHVSQNRSEQQPQQHTSQPAPTATTKHDRTVPLTPVQTTMFRTMTRSLSIPHFLYTTTANITSLTTLRKRLNSGQPPEAKLTHLPFIVKAVSLAFQHHPLLNTHLDTASDANKSTLTHKAAHNFGIAIDTPSGLLVPVLRDVQLLSIREISHALSDISSRARANKLSPADFKDASFTISNIGNIGGGVVAPVISAPQVGILGVGRSKVVPAFDEDGGLVKKEELVLSWSADHRVVDGAECARCAERVVGFLEDVGGMVVDMR